MKNTSCPTTSLSAGGTCCDPVERLLPTNYVSSSCTGNCYLHPHLCCLTLSPGAVVGAELAETKAMPHTAHDCGSLSTAQRLHLPSIIASHTPVGVATRMPPQLKWGMGNNINAQLPHNTQTPHKGISYTSQSYNKNLTLRQKLS